MPLPIPRAGLKVKRWVRAGRSSRAVGKDSAAFGKGTVLVVLAYSVARRLCSSESASVSYSPGTTLIIDPDAPKPIAHNWCLFTDEI